VKSRGSSAERASEILQIFGDRVREGVHLAPYTSSRIGGPADFFIEVKSKDDIVQAVRQLWEMEIPFHILGGGSNVLVSDSGVRGMVLLNHAREVTFLDTNTSPRVKAESGASLGSVSRRTVKRGWSGLEWAATVPGTIGGAVVGNAGAHGSDIGNCLEVAEILQPGKEVETWPVERFEYDYRTSILKGSRGQYVVLTATFRLSKTSGELAKTRMTEFVKYRQDTQPSGPSWGSMFKNPPGKSAGRLIDTAGLKGLQIGGARVSAKHANFFTNLGDASASDVLRLIKLVRKEVKERFQIELELEVELFGDWEEAELSEFVILGDEN
jgi:UDP-N-acetylmuramate dehydrogenase